MCVCVCVCVCVCGEVFLDTWLECVHFLDPKVGKRRGVCVCVCMPLCV